MPWMRKAEREKLDEQYESIIETLREYPGIFFDELSERSGVPRKRLRPCINYLLKKKEVTADKRYYPVTQQMASKYYLFSYVRPELLGITGDDLAWMAYYRKPRIERLRERIGALS